MKLNLKRKAKKRIITRERQPFEDNQQLNKIWALDFMRDSMYDGRPFRTRNVIDEGNREALRIECGTSIPSRRLVRVMDQLLELYGKPEGIRMDNELNAIGVARKEQAHPRLSKQPKKFSATSKPQSVVTSTCQLGQRFTIMNTRSCSHWLRSSPNLKQSVAQWKVRTLSTGSYWPQRPYREGSIHWAKLQSNPDKGLMI